MKAAGERLGARMRALGQPWELGVFLWLPFLLFTLVVAADLRMHGSLGDWEIFRSAARSVAHGYSPYPAADPTLLSHNDQFVYPPITAFLLAPLAVLPAELGRVFVLLLTLACVPAALRLLGVGDWRCYGLALLTAPVLDTVSLGALSSVLLLGVAAVWRFRDRRYLAASITALVAVAKVFLWPLVIWLLATRRWRTAAAAGAVSLVLLLGGWAAIAFDGLRGYPHLLRVLSKVEAAQSYSLAGLLHVSGGAAMALSGALALAVVTAVLLAGRGANGDKRAFAVAVAGALLATPVLWLHYLVLLFVPIALARPRLSALWFAPLAFWVTPLAHSNGSVWRMCFVLAVAALIVLRALAPASNAAPARRPGLAAIRRVLPAR
jgi:hypothetical protein